MMMYVSKLGTGVLLLLLSSMVNAVVLYDEGRQIIDGISLLQDKDNPSAYYYLPTSPRVSIVPGSDEPEMLFVKFVDPEGKISGGLIHFLFTLDLPPDQIEAIEKKLRKKVGGASIRGPVILRAEGSEETGGASFKIISSVLSDKQGENAFTSSLVSSGIAPVTPGSRAAVAARLNEHGATLLWESLTRPTSDISVSLSASYEAALPAYQGRVTANLDTVYEHIFKVRNEQKGFRKAEIRNHFDELQRSGVIEVDVTDRAGLAVNSGQLQKLMNLVTEKLVELLFNTSTGLSKLPDQVEVSKDIVKGRQKRGFLTTLIRGTGNKAYYTDDQLTLREKKDIKKANFSLLFTHNTTIKVPFDSTGNIRGLYEIWGDNPKIFKTVSLKDSAFERRDIFFDIDPSFYQSFQSQINSVSVEFVKQYRPTLDENDFTSEVVFNQVDVKKGSFSKSIGYPRLGIESNDWHNYKYNVLWNFRGGKTIRMPGERQDYIDESAPSITLAPPADLQLLEIDTDPVVLVDAGVRRVAITFKYPFLGQTKQQSIVIRPGEEEVLKKVSVLTDRGATVEYQVKWYTRDGSRLQSWAPLDSTYIFLQLPSWLAQGGL